MLHVLRSFFSLIVPILLIAVHCAVMLCFINRWDTMVTVTLVPIWMWAAVAVIAGFFGWLLFKSRLSLLVMLIWLATALVCSDETPALLRTVKNFVIAPSEPAIEKNGADTKGQQPHAANENLKLSIVTLNCDQKHNSEAAARSLVEQLTSASASASAGDAGSAKAQGGPDDFDVVFLQEAPKDEVLSELTRELFGTSGSWLSHQGCAILARGRLDELPMKFEIPGSVPGTQIAARLELEPGTQIELVNVHLELSVMRYDVWRREAWQEHTNLRIANRSRLKEILKAMPDSPVKRPRIIGGDFGTPYNDDIFRVLQRDHADAFRSAGTGWGNTYPAKFPLLRIDQIWADDELTPLTAVALPAANSDHRQVRVKFRIKTPGGFLAMR
jgi:endonuclease/exonuclease/phosphatase (EEP) superfamily protein YafD